ncbi:MAG TPA: hypothetical protein VIM84_11320 [Gemmatimonadales bacterium]
MPLFPLPGWVTITSSALLTFSLLFPPVLNRFLRREEHAAVCLLREATYGDYTPEQREIRTGAAMTLMAQAGRKWAVLARLGRRWLVLLAALSWAVLTTQILSTAFTGE